LKIIADIHIHSPWSRATSSRLSPASLERWARIKGIGLLGTGDCTHPRWIEELRDNLEDNDSGSGFYKLKEKTRLEFDAGPALAEGLPRPGRSDCNVHFILTGEISTIYKKAGKTRKVHHVVVLPDFKAAAVFNAKLERLGNIHSDGRPILGLDSENLLSLLLETDDRAMLIPAHIWTPWFSVLGAKSGFDSIEECYGSLASHIPAIETGLSSNPPMNWALSNLDRYAIISNSDAHSLDKLGREATVFDMELSYDSFRQALYRIRNSPNTKEPPGITATIEFFPQEGKYHYDGHRSCGICLGPEETAQRDGICPVCGKPLTRGVIGRVLELADRPVDETAPCPEEQTANKRPYYSLIPLKEIIGELLETGNASKRVEAAYGALIEKAGNEFSLLLDISRENIEKLNCPGISGELLAKAIGRMRRGEVSISPGYDGEYGVIRTFAAGEAKESGIGLFEDNIVNETNTKKKARQAKQKVDSLVNDKKQLPQERVFSLDADQMAAVSSGLHKGIIIAGPGTGKTAVLAAKITRVISEGTNPDSVLAVSFTVKAAAELRDRVLHMMQKQKIEKPETEKPVIVTFHSLCASILREQYAAAGLPSDFKILSETERDELLVKICAITNNKTLSPRRLGEYIEERKRYLLLPGEKPKDLSRILPVSLVSFIPEDNLGDNDSEAAAAVAYAEYRKQLLSLGAVDYDGLIAGTVRLFAVREDILKKYYQKFRFIFVDEYQDINFAQYALIRLLVGNEAAAPSLWVIGDPNQAIYGFRGSDKGFIDRFMQDYPDAGYFELKKSFRCAEPIIKAAGKLARTKLKGADEASSSHVSLFRRTYPTDKSEAEGIARIIASLVGGTSFFALDSKTTKGIDSNTADFSPSDCAILVRVSALAEPVAKALNDHGIPFEIAGAQTWWEEEPVKTLLENLRTQQSEDIRAVWDSINTKDKNPTAPVPETIEHLIRLAALFGNTQALLDNLSTGQGLPDTPREGVRVMTIHASKGLEFDHVFVAGLEEGILPFTLYNEHPDIEEERRLLYVAMTRARRGLWLSYSASRNFRGRVLKNPPSRFLSELETLVPLVTEERQSKWDGQMSLF
jgi:uncharacterized protein (TIGR00375 family)